MNTDKICSSKIADKRLSSRQKHITRTKMTVPIVPCKQMKTKNDVQCAEDGRDPHYRFPDHLSCIQQGPTIKRPRKSFLCIFRSAMCVCLLAQASLCEVKLTTKHIYTMTLFMHKLFVRVNIIKALCIMSFTSHVCAAALREIPYWMVKNAAPLRKKWSRENSNLEKIGIARPTATMYHCYLRNSCISRP